MYKEVENKLIIKDTTLDEVLTLVPCLREDDKREVEAAGFTPKDGLLFSYNVSDIVKTVFAGETLLGIYGVSTKCLPKGYCSIWFLGTDESEKYPIAFVREGKNLIKQVLKKYNILNWVYSENRKHITYLKRIGLTVDEENPVQMPKGVFYPFYKLREE